jgi:enoyl-CoA hydratase/carnithine racemase
MREHAGSEVTSDVDADSDVAPVVISRPRNNYLDISLLTQVCDQLGALDSDPQCLPMLLLSNGKHFCADRDFTGRAEPMIHRKPSTVRLPA